MKKLTLIMLVAMVPFLTTAQKRSKKDKDETAQQRKVAQESYHFMVITGYAMTARTASDLNSSEDMLRAAMDSRLKITFDVGGLRMTDGEELSETQYKSMAHAVNSAGRFGWEFLNANVQVIEGATVHYYYMRKKK